MKHRRQTFGSIGRGLGLLFVLFALLFIGCAAKQRFTPVNRAFLEDTNISSKRDNLPFDHAWTAPGVDKVNYRYLYIKPVRMDKLDLKKWSQSMSVLLPTEAEYRAKAEEVGKYFHEQLIAELRKAKEPKFVVVDRPGTETLILEIALTELEFSHPVAQAGTFASPVPGTGAALSAVTEPHVAFAARLTDVQTGRLVATVADRKFPPARILDLNKFTVSSSVREICALWAQSIAEAFNSDRLVEVKEKKFTLRPW